MSGTVPPRLSVVIPTLGRPILVRTIESLAASQGFDSVEVFVVGVVPDGPVLRSVQKLSQRHPQIHHLPVSFPKGDSSEKKNAGFRTARSDIVAFLDDDVVVAPDWPLRIVEPFADSQVDLVSGPSLIPEDVTLIGRLTGLTLASKAAGYVSERYMQGHLEPRRVRWSQIIGCNMVYRRPLLESIGLFDPDFWPGEEMLASFRAERSGAILMFHPEAYVYHYPRASALRFWKQIHGYGATRVRLIRAGVDFEASTLVPSIWVFSLLVFGAGALFSSWLAGLLWLDLALYVVADAWITHDKFRETRRLVDLLIFFTIPVMHLSYGIGAWTEFFRPGKDLSEQKV